MQCLNNLRQIALASLNYESANMKFPMATGLGVKAANNADHYSGFVAILPFLELKDHHDAITEGTSIDGVEYAPYPALYGDGFPMWKDELPILLCPSLETRIDDAAPTHYGFCIGDRARNITNPESIRAVFANAEPTGFNDLTDGSSNTIFFGEIGSVVDGANESPFATNQPNQLLENPGKCLDLVNRNRNGSWTFKKAVQLSLIGRGGHWADGRAGVALFNTILAPNSPGAAVDGTAGVDGIYSASGPHRSIVNVAFVDGSVHAIDSDIDAGDASHPTPTAREMAERAPTPYGVWGALGTSNTGEVVSDF